jgi:hypothetical protein
MSSDQPDIISSHSNTLSSRFAWAAAALLAAAFVAALVAAVHYHNQVASLQHQLSRVQGGPRAAAAVSVTSSPSGLPVADTRVVMLGSNAFTAQVTLVAASSPARQAYIAVSAQISGGRPHTRYTLLWESDSVTSPQQTTATGVTDANGRADLVVDVSPASAIGSYQLQLVPGIRGFQSFAIYGYWSQPTLCSHGQTTSGC